MRTYLTLLFILLSLPCYAQVITIPDPNLREAIHETVNVPLSDPITRTDIQSLRQLVAKSRDIEVLTGLEVATELDHLMLSGNRIKDITPLANLLKLTHLALGGNRIQDVTPLANLKHLSELHLSNNQITDISPLAALSNLTRLYLTANFIVDVHPISQLDKLHTLEIERNKITDHSPLDTLQLVHYVYDQTCDVPPEPLHLRVTERGFPSIVRFTAGTILNRPDLTSIKDWWERAIAIGAEHDIFIGGTGVFSQFYVNIDQEWNLRGPLDIALERRDRYFARNPHMIFVAKVDLRGSTNFDDFPVDSPYWLRDSSGRIVSEGKARLVNYAHPFAQDVIVGQTLALAKCGLFDGVVYDWWNDLGTSVGDHMSLADAQRARETIVRRVRSQAHPDFLIFGNAGPHTIPLTGSFLNGSAMETLMPRNTDPAQYHEALIYVSNTLKWLEHNLRAPQLNALSTHSLPHEAPDSPANLRWMRACTTLSLTLSDGYVLFAADLGQSHYWYEFWDADLGRPVGEKGQLYQETDGLYIREFTNGWAVHNHSGSVQEIRLHEAAVGVSSRLEGLTHTLADLDGEMYLRVKPANPADVTGDGVVNILDLVVVAQALGTDGARGDVNGDGVVNVFDLVLVAEAF